MTVDYLEGLNLSQEPETVTDADYVAPSSGTGFIVKKGKYLAKQIPGEYGPDKAMDVEFGETRSGHLSANLAWEIIDVGGKHDGRKLRFQRLNTSPYANAKDESRRKMNSAMDYLVAIGVPPRKLQTNKDYARELVNGIGKLVKITVDGDAYCKECGTSFYWSNFPTNSQGELETEMPCPNHPSGGPVIKVRNKITRFEQVAATQRK